MSPDPFVSIIIPTFNRGHMLSATVDSFIDQSYPADRYEIIIADNNSKDNTTHIIREYCIRHENIRTIFESRQGAHYARNHAARISKGDILYYTDDDMIADRNLLREIVKAFELDPQIGSATGMIIGRFDAEPPKWVRKNLINGYLSLTDRRIEGNLRLIPGGLVYSCHQAIKRDAFFSAGGFNPDNTAGTWIGDGETGLNLKLKSKGCKFAFTATSIIYHMIPQYRTTLKYLMTRIGNQGFCDSYTGYRKHRNRFRIIPLMLKRNTMDLTSALATIVIKIVMGKKSWRFLPANLAYFWNRNIYDWQLYTNEGFRKIVEIDDWINDERDIPTEGFEIKKG